MTCARQHSHQSSGCCQNQKQTKQRANQTYSNFRTILDMSWREQTARKLWSDLQNFHKQTTQKSTTWAFWSYTSHSDTIPIPSLKVLKHSKIFTNQVQSNWVAKDNQNQSNILLIKTGRSLKNLKMCYKKHGSNCKKWVQLKMHGVKYLLKLKFKDEKQLMKQKLLMTVHYHQNKYLICKTKLTKDQPEHSYQLNGLEIQWNHYFRQWMKSKRKCSTM